MFRLKPLCWVVYTDDMPERFGGYASGPCVKIRPKYLDDRGLLEHELVHVRQFWRSLGVEIFISNVYTMPRLLKLWGIFGDVEALVNASKKWKLRLEVEAYREQLKHYATDNTFLFAGFLVTKYGLDISVEEAMKLLRNME